MSGLADDNLEALGTFHVAADGLALASDVDRHASLAEVQSLEMDLIQPGEQSGFEAERVVWNVRLYPHQVLEHQVDGGRGPRLRAASRRVSRRRRLVAPIPAEAAIELGQAERRQAQASVDDLVHHSQGLILVTGSPQAGHD